MTTLLIDLGNTALKWCTLEDPEPRTVVHRGEVRCKDALYAEWLSLKPSRVVGSAVAAPRLAFSATKFFNDHGIPWEWVRPQSVFKNDHFVLENGYERPTQLGADRWNAAVGAVSALPEHSLLVVHMGTATTVDAVIMKEPGRYVFEGGRIAPGATLMLSALTDGIPTLDVEMGVWRDFPKRTSDAIATGIVDAQVGLVRQALEALEARAGEARVLLAGGAAQFVAPALSRAIPGLVVHHNLVLKGLAARARLHGEG